MLVVKPADGIVHREDFFLKPVLISVVGIFISVLTVVTTFMISYAIENNLYKSLIDILENLAIITIIVLVVLWLLSQINKDPYVKHVQMLIIELEKYALLLDEVNKKTA